MTVNGWTLSLDEVLNAMSGAGLRESRLQDLGELSKQVRVFPSHGNVADPK